MNTNAIRVLYVTSGRRIGGMETHLLTLASRLPERIRSYVCCMDASTDYRRRLTEAGIDHCNIDCPTLVRPGSFLGYLRFERVVARFQPHLVHTYGFGADVIAAVLRARGAKVRVITSRRGEDANTRHQAVRRLVNHLSERIVCVSSETAKFVQSTESPRPSLVEVIPNGVSVGRSGNEPGKPPRSVIRFGTLGTVKPIKGTDLLVEAFMRFDSTRRVELLIAGTIDRPWADALCQRVRSDIRIRFLGRMSPANDFLADLDVFVLPSRSEGMYNALLEAMALGLPCIATDVGSNRSLLQPECNGPAGIVCAPTSNALFSAMTALAADADARAEFGGRARQHVRDHYAIDAMVNRYDRLYLTIARAGRAHDNSQYAASL